MHCVSGWVEGIGGDAGGVASTPSVFLEDQADALSCDFLGRARGPGFPSLPSADPYFVLRASC